MGANDVKRMKLYQWTVFVEETIRLAVEDGRRRVCVVGLVPRGKNEEVWNELRRYNGVLEWYAEELGAEFVDVWDIFMEDGQLKENKYVQRVRDGWVHMSDLGAWEVFERVCKRSCI